MNPYWSSAVVWIFGEEIADVIIECGIVEIDWWGKMDGVVFVSFEFEAFLYFGGAESAQ